MSKPTSLSSRPGLPVMRRPVGPLGLGVLILVVAIAPAILFFDPINFWLRAAHIARDAISIYRLWSDDVAYVASSRTWERTASSLFVPHNTHIVPAWRILTWALVTWAGKLERLPDVLAIASYTVLVAVMLMTGRLVARETGRTLLGLMAMGWVGTTSLMVSPALWYSAGQPLWAGLGILATLWYAQAYRSSGRWLSLLLAALTAPIAGWFWTVGHLAGPAASVYLWADGRRQCRHAAAVPTAASAVAVFISLIFGARHMSGKLMILHNQAIAEAVDPFRGLLHTAQAIPSNLILGNLGLTTSATPTQGVVLTLLLAALWVRMRIHTNPVAPPELESDVSSGPWRLPVFTFNPLECAGATLVVGGYLIEWSFRGYADFDFWRTTDLHSMVPWYDAIPQIGAVLFTLGWLSGPRIPGSSFVRQPRPIPVTRLGVLGVITALMALIVVNQPRVDELVRHSVPSLLPSELTRFPVEWLQTIRANAVLEHEANWQRSALRRLDHAQELARRMNLDRDTILAAFGHMPLPASFSRQPPAELLQNHDVLAMLDLPEHGSRVDIATVRAALGPFVIAEKEPKPNWLGQGDTWPPRLPSLPAKNSAPGKAGGTPRTSR